MWQFDLSTLSSLNLGKERSVPVALEPGNPGLAMHRRAAVAGAEQRTAWAGFWSLLLSVRENTADMSWSCWEVLVLCYALGAAAFPGRARCDHEGASALEWGLKCVMFWPLTALLTPRNHSNEFVEPASHLLGLNTAKCLCFCDFDIILMYFL